MTTSNALRLIAVAIAAATAGACHASGDHGVSASDHGVTVTFRRLMTQPANATITFQNGAPGPVCLGPASFSPASFEVKTSDGVVQSISPATDPAAACEVLAPGATVSRSVDAGQGFSRLAIQTGRFCYRYAFSGAPAPSAAWQATGTVCE